MSSVAMKYEDWLRGCVHHDGRKGNVYLPCDMVLAIADWIEAHRDVAPVRHGRWAMDSDGCLFCSICENTAEFNPLSGEQMKTRYCNNCGARMDGGNDEID